MIRVVLPVLATLALVAPTHSQVGQPFPLELLEEEMLGTDASTAEFLAHRPVLIQLVNRLNSWTWNEEWRVDGMLYAAELAERCHEAGVGVCYLSDESTKSQLKQLYSEYDIALPVMLTNHNAIKLDTAAVSYFCGGRLCLIDSGGRVLWTGEVYANEAASKTVERALSALRDHEPELALVDFPKPAGRVRKAVLRNRWDIAVHEAEDLVEHQEAEAAQVASAVDSMIDGVVRRIGSALEAGDFLTARELLESHASLAKLSDRSDQFATFERLLDGAPKGIISAQSRLRKMRHSKAISRDMKAVAKHRDKIEAMAEGWEGTHLIKEIQWELDWCDARLAELRRLGR